MQGERQSRLNRIKKINAIWTGFQVSYIESQINLCQNIPTPLADNALRHILNLAQRYGENLKDTLRVVNRVIMNRLKTVTRGVKTQAVYKTSDFLHTLSINIHAITVVTHTEASRLGLTVNSHGFIVPVEKTDLLGPRA